MNSKRFYRHLNGSGRLIPFTVTVKETDLWIAVSRDAYRVELVKEIEEAVWQRRLQMEAYLAAHPDFKNSLEPCFPLEGAPRLISVMARAGNRAGVGPMAAVAGALAEDIGRLLLRESPEVIVENGGDLFIKVEEAVKIGIYAGNSKLSGRLAMRVDPAKTPLGVCTSSGTVGPSLSFGRADAAMVLSPLVALADAVATALGNRVSGPEDFSAALEYARAIDDIKGALLICAGKIAAWGDIELIKL
jgi:uncharacterized protein